MMKFQYESSEISENLTRDLHFLSRRECKSRSDLHFLARAARENFQKWTLITVISLILETFSEFTTGLVPGGIPTSFTVHY